MQDSGETVRRDKTNDREPFPENVQNPTNIDSYTIASSIKGAVCNFCAIVVTKQSCKSNDGYQAKGLSSVFLGRGVLLHTALHKSIGL